MTSKRQRVPGRFYFDEWIPNPWVRWSVYFAFWTFWGLLNAAHSIQDFARLTPPVPAWKPLTYEMTSLYTMGLLVPLVVRFVLRFPLSRDRWLLPLLAHLPGVVGFSLLHTFGFVMMRKLVFWTVGGHYDFSDDWSQSLLYEFSKDVGTYVVILSATLALEFYSRYRERKYQASELHRRLVEAQLENLKGHLNPHFLFNTLNVISSYMYEDVAEADRLISKLSDLLRVTLETSTRSLVPLRRELEVLDLYSDLMRARFQDQLVFQIEVEPSVKDALVPALILQILVENAVHHGTSKRAETGRILVSVGRQEDRLVLQVEDNGAGTDLPLEELAERGSGLANILQRLERIYDEAPDVTASRSRWGGFAIRVALPHRIA